MSQKSKKLVVIAGPTGVGKTALSIKLAHYFKTEIISADSRQFYKEISIGTAKPSFEEMEGITHHFIDVFSLENEYSVGNFENDVLALLKKLFQNVDLVFLVGGSGLFVKAVCEGLDDMPAIDPSIRNFLNAKFENQGLAPLLEQLKWLDPQYYFQVDQQNSQRVIRALEVCIGTGRPFSSFRTQITKKRDFELIKIGIELEREILYNQINSRVDKMIAQGLENEAKSVFHLKHLNSLQTVGYNEFFDYFEGKIDLKTAIDLIKQNSRRYAKRQLTWFKKDTQFQWFSPLEVNEIIEYIQKNIEK